MAVNPEESLPGFFHSRGSWFFWGKSPSIGLPTWGKTPYLLCSTAEPPSAQFPIHPAMKKINGSLSLVTLSVRQFLMRLRAAAQLVL